MIGCTCSIGAATDGAVHGWGCPIRTCRAKHPRGVGRCDLRRGHSGKHQTGGFTSWVEWTDDEHEPPRAAEEE